MGHSGKIMEFLKCRKQNGIIPCQYNIIQITSSLKTLKHPYNEIRFYIVICRPDGYYLWTG